jgi:hypothetical protein
MALKNAKKTPQNPKPKIFMSLVFRHFQDKKTRSSNSFYHMESFDIKSDHFSG